MITRATVLSVSGDKARVRALRQSACEGCEGCAQKGSCHGEMLLSDTPKSYELDVKNTAGAGVGDFVEIESSGNFILLFAVIIFILPIALTVGAYLICDSLFDAINPVLVSAITFAASFVCFAFVSNKLVPMYSANKISKIIKENSDKAV